MNNYDILIVDDDLNIIKSLSRSLWPLHVAIHTANSGEDGLSLMERQDIDLVISDMKMPGMGGLAFLKKIQLDHPHVFTILLTAHGELETAMEAINNAGVYKFLTKPWHADFLRLTVQRALEGRKVIMERNLLIHKVKRQEAILRDLENRYPGITKKNVDENGSIVI